MDLTSLADDAVYIVGAVVMAFAVPIANKGINVLRDRLHLQISDAQQAQIDAAVSAGAGLLRAKLAGGTMKLDDVHVGNAHVEQAASYALDVMNSMALAGGVNKDTVAKMVVGVVGHALGDDPSVATVAAPTQAADAAVKP